MILHYNRLVYGQKDNKYRKHTSTKHKETQIKHANHISQQERSLVLRSSCGKPKPRKNSLPVVGLKTVEGDEHDTHYRTLYCLASYR